MAADDVFKPEGANGAHELAFSIANRLVLFAGGGVDGEVGEDLEEVVLDDVKQGSDLVVKLAAVFDAEVLSHGDLNGADVIAVPDGLEHGVGEAGVEDVLDRLFAEEMVDAEY